jgi:hypothetical protein
VFGRKAAEKVSIGILREVIRDEIKNEMNRLMSPTFVELVTRGQRDMEQIFDAVRTFQDDLDALKLTVDIIEAKITK